MADNVAFTPGSGATGATDDIGGVHYPRVKIALGADGSAVDAVAGAGAVSTAVQRVTLASDDPAVTALQILDNAISGSEMQVDVVAALPAGTNNIGDVDVLSVPAAVQAALDAIETATEAIQSQTADVAHDAADSGNPVKIGGYASAAAPSGVSGDADRVNAWFLRNGAQATVVTAAGALIGGDATNGLDVDVTRMAALVAGTANIGDVDVVGGLVAHDGADSGNPIKVGGRARSTEIAAVASDDRADFVTDLVGKQIVLPYANPENFVSGAITSAMTGTTSTSLIAAPASGLRNYITTIVVSNAHATVGTDIVIQDGSGGTTLMTIPAAAVYGGAVINLPVPLRQPTTATAIFCANVTTGASTKVSAVGYKGV